MAKILCVLYDDPIDGYPKSYPRDDLPKKVELIGVDCN
jgi:formate dehydrogenase